MYDNLLFPKRFVVIGWEVLEVPHGRTHWHPTLGFCQAPSLALSRDDSRQFIPLTLLTRNQALTLIQAQEAEWMREHVLENPDLYP